MCPNAGFSRGMALVRIAALMLALALALALPAVAGARTGVRVGIGDQNAGMFDQPAFTALKLRRARYFISWDAIRRPAELAAADAYVDRARRAHIRVLLHISTNDISGRRGKLPSTTAYQRYVGRLVRHFRPRGVHDWGVWNEANHRSQPTWRSPRQAARYYRVMRRICRGCAIVALDVLDQRGVARYIRRWYGSLSRSLRARARLVGIHNYSDTNRFRSRGTRSIIRTARRYNRHARFWMTETGGVVNFGRSFPCSPRRAAKAVSYMFTLARAYRRYVKRLYAYNWTGAGCHGTAFDAGLVAPSGARRPGYFVFKRRLAGFLR
jgi:hypothetical protein